MSKLVRLSYSMLNSRMEEHSDGTFVLYSKYEELKAQLDEITEIIGMEDGGRICQNDAYYRIVELMENK